MRNYSETDYNDFLDRDVVDEDDARERELSDERAVEDAEADRFEYDLSFSDPQVLAQEE